MEFFANMIRSCGTKRMENELDCLPDEHLADLGVSRLGLLVGARSWEPKCPVGPRVPQLAEQLAIRAFPENQVRLKQNQLFRLTVDPVVREAPDCH